MTILAVRYWPSDSDDPVIEQVQDEEQQAALVAFMILDLGRATAEPVTLEPRPDAAKNAKIRRDLVEGAVATYADDEDDDAAFGTLASIQPALHDLSNANSLFEEVRHAADAYTRWMQVQDPNFEIRSVEPAIRHGEVVTEIYRQLLDEALDALMSLLDSCGSQEAGEHTDTAVKGAA